MVPVLFIKNWAAHDKTNKMACAPNEDLDQSDQCPLSLISVFAVRMKKGQVFSYPLSTQRRLWFAGMPRLI